MYTPRIGPELPLWLALPWLALVVGCMERPALTQADTSLHVTPKRQVSDVALSALQASRDRALTIVKNLSVSGDQTGVLCAPSYCGAEGTRCRGMRSLSKTQNDTARERLLSPSNATELKRALQRIEFEMTDEELRSGGSVVPLVRAGDVVRANRTRIRQLDGEATLELLLAETTAMASLGAAGPFGGEREAAEALSGCLVSYSRSIEGKPPRTVAWDASRVILDTDPTTSPKFTSFNGYQTSTYNLTFGDVRITIEANWLQRILIRKAVTSNINFGYDVESIYTAATNRYQVRILDSATGAPSPPTVLATAEVERLASDDAEAQMQIDFKQNDIVVRFRGEEVVRGSRGKGFGALVVKITYGATTVRRIRAEVLP
jgi:hypothetical protein